MTTTWILTTDDHYDHSYGVFHSAYSTAAKAISAAEALCSSGADEDEDITVERDDEGVISVYVADGYAPEVVHVVKGVEIL